MRVSLGIACIFSLFVADAQASGGGAYWENGDFLLPKPKDGTFALVDTGERYGVWRVIGVPGTVAWVSGTYQHHGFSFPAQGTTTAQQAEPWVNLAGVTMSATGVMHSPVATTVGQSYKLSFYVGNLVDPAGIYGQSSTVKVYENATLIGTATNSNGAGTTTENWKSFSITFTADAAYTTIAFVNGDPVGDMNCGISNTMLAPVGSNATKRMRP